MAIWCCYVELAAHLEGDLLYKNFSFFWKRGYFDTFPLAPLKSLSIFKKIRRGLNKQKKTSRGARLAPVQIYPQKEGIQKNLQKKIKKKNLRKL